MKTLKRLTVICFLALGVLFAFNQTKVVYATEISTESTESKETEIEKKEGSYKIKFDGNGATSGKMKTKTCKFDTSYKLSANKFKKKGYTFTGWNTKKNGKGKTYKNKASIENLTSKNGKTVTLYAQWKKTKYTITYNLNGGKNNKSNKSSYYITTKTFKLKNPTRKGYTFKGWYTDKKCTKKITQIKKGSKKNYTLYAKWKKTKYTITYVLNGGENRIENIDYYYITSDTKALLNPTKAGYLFEGWYSDKKCTKKVAEIKKGSTGNKTLYAKWKKESKKNLEYAKDTYKTSEKVGDGLDKYRKGLSQYMPDGTQLYVLTVYNGYAGYFFNPEDDEDKLDKFYDAFFDTIATTENKLDGQTSFRGNVYGPDFLLSDDYYSYSFWSIKASDPNGNHVCGMYDLYEVVGFYTDEDSERFDVGTSPSGYEYKLYATYYKDPDNEKWYTLNKKGKKIYGEYDGNFEYNGIWLITSNDAPNDVSAGYDLYDETDYFYGSFYKTNKGKWFYYNDDKERVYCDKLDNKIYYSKDEEKWYISE